MLRPLNCGAPAGRRVLLPAWRTLRADRLTQTIDLPGYGRALPPRLLVDGRSFVRKGEFHLTVVGSALGGRLLAWIDAGLLDERALAALFETGRWVLRPLAQGCLLSRPAAGGRQSSVVQLVDVPALAAFYRQLRRLLPAAAVVPTPPAHVTLYTRNVPLGIGVSSEQALRRLTRRKLDLRQVLC